MEIGGTYDSYMSDNLFIVVIVTVVFVSGNVSEQLALLDHRKQKGGVVGPYISFYCPPLGQQNLHRRRFDPLGNRDTPTNETCISLVDGPQHISKYD